MRNLFAVSAALAVVGATIFFAAASGCDSEDEADAGLKAPLCDLSKIMNSCLSGLNGCFVPSGKCTAKSIGEYHWANGATLLITATETNLVSNFEVSAGETCFEMTVPFDGSDSTITTADGTEYKVHTEVDVPGIGSITIGCPDGSEETYTEADYEALRACFQGLDSMAGGTGGTDGGSISCTCEDGTYGCIFGGATACETDADCQTDGGTALCCMYMGYRYCAAECQAQ